MAAEFVALADLLRAPVARGEVAAAAEAADALEAPVVGAAPLRRGVPENAVRRGDAGASGTSDDGRAAVVAALRDARLFRARLVDAFDDAAARLLRELACDVLARELRLAPCDLAELVRRARERMPVVRVRVAACDVLACDVVRVAGMASRDGDVAVVEDSALAGGDAIVELAGGALDARLGVRLASVLEAFA